ncbi:MAG: bifunctional 3,4-dihydroxy-2-butanone-4-phosphate synthase/GTP cyclohydrolase II [Candidatus Hydrogenedentota bacterium]|nr:MAG: bifunctional 3,4-dihydroxy-2-butanone-4-phosphate synthase/GTP cyclohydrolase II [Candidatus Hydrogenedentota bacterium]
MQTIPPEVKASVPDAIEEIKRGNMLIVTDSEDRENEGDLVMAAEDATPEAINFMAMQGRGLICVPLTEQRAKELDLGPMVKNNQDIRRTAFTVSVDAKEGITTGISAFDRAHTIQLLADLNSTADDFVRPGHVFPLVARPGGVLVRAGHTEASLDLVRMAGKKEIAVICEIMKEDGNMARMPDLVEFAKKHKLKILTIQDLIEYRRQRENLVREVARSKLPTEFGEFIAIAFENTLDDKVNVALVMGEITPDDPVLVRVHSECLTGDVFHSARCDCGQQLEAAMKQIAKEGKGVLVYMRQEGRGIGIVNKLKAYAYQDQGYDTVEANEKLGFPPDLRDYGIGAQILVSLGVRKIRLMTNNPRKVVGLEGYGLHIVERVPLIMEANPYNEKYLKTKASKLGHFLGSDSR